MFRPRLQHLQRNKQKKEKNQVSILQGLETDDRLIHSKELEHGLISCIIVWHDHPSRFLSLDLILSTKYL